MRNILPLKVAIKYDGLLPEDVTVSSPGTYGLPRHTSTIVVQFKFGKRAEPSKWREPVHQAMANIPTIDLRGKPRFSTEAALGEAIPKHLREFVKRYGPVTSPEMAKALSGTGGKLELSGKIASLYNLPTTIKVPPVLHELPREFAALQFLLRMAWRGDGDALSLLMGENKNIRSDELLQFFEIKGGKQHWVSETYVRPIYAHVVMHAGTPEIVTNDLWSFLRLSFLRDYQHGLTAICKNKTCPKPYFLQLGPRRREYCCHKCAMADASRAYRERVKKGLELLERSERK